MSNPYAPPEDRPREPRDEQGAGRSDGPTGAPSGPPPGWGGDPRHGAPPPWGGPQGPYPGRAPGRPPQPAPPPDPRDVERVARLARTVFVLVLAATLTSWMPLPWRLGGIAFAAAGVAAGVHALQAAVRARVRGALPVMLGLSLALNLSWVASLGGSLLLWPQQQDHEQCLARALTVSAQHECESAYRQAVQDRLGTPVSLPLP